MNTTRAIRSLTWIVPAMRERKRVYERIGRGSAGCLIAMGLLAGQARAGVFDISHYLYVGSDPLDERLDWSDGAQGIAHDATHWYLAQQGGLWRVPVSVDLGSLTFNTPGISYVPLSSIPQLTGDGYDHLGDLVCYEHEGNGYVLVPIEADSRAGVAVFRAGPTLAYIDHINLFPDAESRQSHWSWAAVDPEGRLYSSNFDDVDRLFRYQVDWAHLDSTDELLISNSSAEEILLHSGEGVLTLSKVQGGEFTPGGELLYMLTGYPLTDSDGHGLHVFETSGFFRVAGSSNGLGPFNYEFSPITGDEPEGVTIWDLEGTASPHRGQMHALLLDNEVGDTDKVYVKHYTDVIMVDRAHTGSQTGTPELPFRTIAGALGLAWGGAEVRVRAGSYSGVPAIAQCVRLSAEGGLVRISQ